GYWGDHQIIYLLKFLEALPRHFPDALTDLLDREIFCYANVPYRLKPFPEIVADPQNTIRFDSALEEAIEQRESVLGTDGRLLSGPDGSIVHVNLLEKLVVPALSKLSNLVADGGIWMNTQRPEWNDANNALVGNGLSMVTLGYLRRYLAHLDGILESWDVTAAPVSGAVVQWLRDVSAALDTHRSMLDASPVDPQDRRVLLTALGESFSRYREQVYASGPGRKEPLPVEEIRSLCRTALEYLDHAVEAGRRDDGLFHSYNLLVLRADTERAVVTPLPEMLEGQVAALSSGKVDAHEALELIARLFESELYRPDQRSFLLYPERRLPTFFERNRVPEAAAAIPLVAALLERGDGSVIARDADGVLRFHGDFRNADDVDAALNALAHDPEWADHVLRDRNAVLATFEEVFRHHAFTGRSGTMYGFEGLGCVYWHMVAKLLLAVQEIALRAFDDGGSPADCRALAEAYYRIRSGLGFEKDVTEYGAFPTDPYSHTPPHAGAKQPGMTGQVKEEILTRLGEFGVRVENGCVRFAPVLLRRTELLREGAVYRYYDVAGDARSLDVPAGALAFSYCQVPVLYELGNGESWIRVTRRDGSSTVVQGDTLDADTSRRLFERAGDVSQIDVGIPVRSLI
ncbi:MAG: hypothetical protein HKN12_04930, partial [Gemmatimonadetes bacterium]|nr:hypothetical protein [Gemmatimonadota bacterium]